MSRTVIAAFLALSLIVGYLGQRMHADRFLIDQQFERTALIESKLSDIAFAYRCPDCGVTIWTDWHQGDTQCRVCQRTREFAGLTVHDPHHARGTK